MGKYLLVAHQTAERQELLDAAKELVAKDSRARFTLLVPATPAGDLLTWDEGETKEIARARAQSAAAWLQVWRSRAATLPECRSNSPILSASGSNSCARLFPASAGWRCWATSAIPSSRWR